VRMKLEAFPALIDIPTYRPRVPDGEPAFATIKYLANFVGTTIVTRPPGYIVPASVAAHLAQHGLAIDELPGREGDVEIATAAGFDTEGGRKILEANTVGDLRVDWKKQARAFPAGSKLVRTEQPLGAIAVYLCEPESDDGAVENGLVASPSLGAEFPIWRSW
jgi:hypothetical protein